MNLLLCYVNDSSHLLILFWFGQNHWCKKKYIYISKRKTKSKRRPTESNPKTKVNYSILKAIFVWRYYVTCIFFLNLNLFLTTEDGSLDLWYWHQAGPLPIFNQLLTASKITSLMLLTDFSSLQTCNESRNPKVGILLDTVHILVQHLYGKSDSQELPKTNVKQILK